MHDADTIETINCEQLATATDRLLLRGGRRSKRRPSTRAFSPHAAGSWAHVMHSAPLARASQPQIAPAWAAHHSQSFESSHHERTVSARRRNPAYAQVFAITIMIPTLVGLALGIAALL
jgi:hypothetical protein